MASVTCKIDGRQEEIPLMGEVTTVGRSHEADIHIHNDRKISRLHLQFVHRPEGYFVEHLSSKTKTRLNGKLIAAKSPQKLQDADDVEFGKQRMVFSRQGGESKPSFFGRLKGLFGR